MFCFSVVGFLFEILLLVGGFLMLGFICILSLGVLCMCVCAWGFVVGFNVFGFGLFGVFLLSGWV